jgi:hypothetical protein
VFLDLLRRMMAETGPADEGASGSLDSALVVP